MATDVMSLALSLLTPAERLHNLFVAISNKKLAEAKQLLDAGVSCNQFCGGGWAAIHLAAAHLASLRLLVEYGQGNINLQTRCNGDTPLHLAAWRGNSAVVHYCLTHAAIPNIQNFLQYTPLQLVPNGGWFARFFNLHTAEYCLKHCAVMTLMEAPPSPPEQNSLSHGKLDGDEDILDSEDILGGEDTLAELLDCDICLDPLVQPAGLPCGHTFCLKCLQSVIAHTENSPTFACPLDRFKFPKGFPLKLNVRLQKIIEYNKVHPADSYGSADSYGEATEI